MCGIFFRKCSPFYFSWQTKCPVFNTSCESASGLELLLNCLLWFFMCSFLCVTGHMLTLLILGWTTFSNKKGDLDTLLLVQNFPWKQPYENVSHQCFLDTCFWKQAYVCEWKFVKNNNTETSRFYRSQGWWLISESSKLWLRAVQSRSVSLAKTERMPVFKGHGCHRSAT